MTKDLEKPALTSSRRGSASTKYLNSRREALGGTCPGAARKASGPGPATGNPHRRFWIGSGDREISHMAFVRDQSRTGQGQGWARASWSHMCLKTSRTVR